MVLAITVTIAGYAQADTTDKHCQHFLSGRVLDEHDQTALEFASVYIVQLNRTQTTGLDGRFRFENICDGVYTVRIAHAGCDEKDFTVRVQGNTRKIFYLEHHAELLQGVDIKFIRSVEMGTETRHSLTENDREQSSGEDLAEMLTRVPGVRDLNTGSNIHKPVIHGLTGNRVLIVDHGVRLEGQQWGGEHAPETDPFSADRISVIKGASGVRYGPDAMGGVILLESSRVADSVLFRAGLQNVIQSNGRSYTGGLFLEGRPTKNKALAYRVNGSWKYGGDTRTARYLIANSGQREKNVSAELNWEKDRFSVHGRYSFYDNELGIFSGSHVDALDEWEEAIASDTPLVSRPFSYSLDEPKQHIRHEIAQIRAEGLTGNRGKWVLTPSWQNDIREEFPVHEHEEDTIVHEEEPPLHLELQTLAATLAWEHYLPNGFSGVTGVSGQMQVNRYTGRFFIPDYDNGTYGAFVLERWKRRHHELEAGLRFDQRQLQMDPEGKDSIVVDLHRFSGWSGNLGWMYTPDSLWRFTINTGLAWRGPTANELHSSGLHHGSIAYEYGNPLLGTEQAWNNVLNIGYTQPLGWQMEATAYANYIDGFITQVPVGTIVATQGVFPVFQTMQSTAFLYGADVNINYRWKKWQLGANYNMVRARDVENDTWVYQMPADQVGGEVVFVSSGKKHPQHEWQWALEATHTFQQTRGDVDRELKAAPPAYTLLNARVSSKFNWKEHTLTVSLVGKNILNAAYRDYMDRFRYFTHGRGINVQLRVAYYLTRVKID